MLQLKSGIISDVSFEKMTVADISNMIREQMERFMKLFSFSEDKFMEGQLRKRYHVSLLESKMRRQNNPKVKKTLRTL